MKNAKMDTVLNEAKDMIRAEKTKELKEFFLDKLVCIENLKKQINEKQKSIAKLEKEIEDAVKSGELPTSKEWWIASVGFNAPTVTANGGACGGASSYANNNALVSAFL